MSILEILTVESGLSILEATNFKMLANLPGAVNGNYLRRNAPQPETSSTGK